jgi:hypothetical protein
MRHARARRTGRYLGPPLFAPVLDITCLPAAIVVSSDCARRVAPYRIPRARRGPLRAAPLRASPAGCAAGRPLAPKPRYGDGGPVIARPFPKDQRRTTRPARRHRRPCARSPSHRLEFAGRSRRGSAIARPRGLCSVARQRHGRTRLAGIRAAFWGFRKLGLGAGTPLPARTGSIPY